jgi:hypothetical protein
MKLNSITTKLSLMVVLSLAAPVGAFAGRADSPGEPNAVSDGAQKQEIPVVVIEVGVDPRVELMSIIFRLAGHPEYNMGRVLMYIAAVEKQFGPHRKHPVVRLAADLRRRRGVSYDAVMSMAVHLKDANALAEQVPFEPRPKGLDGRWRVDEARDFLDKARDFVRETKFDEFINAHQDFYDRASQRLRKLLEREANLKWFDGFFGVRPKASFRVAIGMANGPNCYGAAVSVGDSEQLYCILGAWKCGMLGWGEPEFDKSMLPTVVHEFCHSYTNSLVDAHFGELEEAAERLFKRVGARMKRMAYGNPKTMMRESMVRACVIRYMHATDGAGAAGKQAESDIRRGFLWIAELAELLGRYEAQREKYPTLEQFLPEVVAFFNAYELPER